MKIGDRVRMLHDKIDGIVVRVLANNQVEIEDTDGFTFPVLKSDLILVNPMESEYFPDADKNQEARGKSQDSTHKTQDIRNKSQEYRFETRDFKAKTGFLQLAIINESQNYGIYVLNGTKENNFVSVYTFDASIYTFLESAIMKPNSKLRVALMPLSKIESIKSIQVLWHECGNSIQKPSFYEQLIPLKASKIMQANDEIVELNTKGFIRPLSGMAAEILPQEMNHLLANKEEVKEEKSVKQIEVPIKEIDLHAEALGIDLKLSSSEILRKQIHVFREKIESAIVHNFDYIIFIHGVGDGVLKNEVYRAIKDYPDVKHFEDAQKSKFGYGAVKVVFR